MLTQVGQKPQDYWVIINRSQNRIFSSPKWGVLFITQSLSSRAFNDAARGYSWAIRNHRPVLPMNDVGDVLIRDPGCEWEQLRVSPDDILKGLF